MSEPAGSGWTPHLRGSVGPMGPMGPPGASFSFANEAAATAEPVAGVSDGVLANIRSHDSYWQLFTSTTALVANKVIASSDAARRWFRMPWASPIWANTTAWRLNSAAGNDENSGLAGFPLRTWAEWRRRTSNLDLTANTSVTIEDTGVWPVADPWDFDGIKLNTSIQLTIIGQRTLRADGAGVLTAVQALNRGADQAVEIEAAGLANSWTLLGHVGKLIRMTSGAAAGSWSWIALDMGTANRRARVGVFTTQATPVSGLVQVTPAIGDSFEVYDLTSAPKLNGTLESLRGYGTLAGALSFEDINFAVAPTHQGHDRVGCRVNRCSLPAGASFGGSWVSNNCLASLGSSAYGFGLFSTPLSSATINGGVVLGGAIDLFSGYLLVTGDTLIQGGSILLRPGQIGGAAAMVSIFNIGFFDCVANACLRASLAGVKIFEATGVNYGSGNGTGILATGNGRTDFLVRRDAGALSMGCTVAEVNINGAIRLFADPDYVDANVNAGILTR